MDKNEKIAVARRKLKRFQARSAGTSPARSLGGGGVTTRLNEGLRGDGVRVSTPATSWTPVSSVSVTPLSDSPTPPQTKSVKLSSTEGLREMSQEISQLLSRSALPSFSLPPPSLPPPSSSAPSLLPPSFSMGSSPISDHPGSLMKHAPSFPSPSLHHTPPYRTHESPNPLDTMVRGSPNSVDGDRTSLERQMKVHAQTIDVLVSEKSTLQTELSAQQRLVEAKRRECVELTSDLQAAQRKLEEVGREKARMSEEITRREMFSSQSESQLRGLRENVERLRSSLEDQRQENTELISKITSQAAEINALQTANTELQSKLNMSELLAQQLSSGGPVHEAPPPDPTPSQVEELRGEVGRVRLRVEQLTGERDQAFSDLTALRDAMMAQQEEGAKKLAGLQGRLAEADLQITTLTGEMATLQQERECMMEEATSGRSELQRSSQAAMEALQHERDQLHRQLQHQLRDNGQLSRLNEEQEERLCELDEELRRVKEEVVDQHGLLTTMHQDKETISRAMSQNKELKANLLELQDAFVRLSQQNMELASALESERHRIRELSRVRESEEKEEGGGGEELPVPAGQIAPEGVAAASDGSDQENRQLLALRSERDSLLEELQRVREEYNRLRGEHERDLDVASLPEEEEEGYHGDTMDVHNMTVEELTTLQNNFTALQQRFMAVMSEKADLLERIQEEEHRILQLAGETETIGEYVALYQTQREALREKFLEKDQFIQGLMAEKEAMQSKLHQLQELVRELLAERASHRHTPRAPSPSPQPPASIPATNKTDVPFHLRPQTFYHTPNSSHENHTHPPSEDHTHFLDVSDEGGAHEGTAEQIMMLLDQLGSGGSERVTFVPCSCCTGQLVAV